MAVERTGQKVKDAPKVHPAHKKTGSIAQVTASFLLDGEAVTWVLAIGIMRGKHSLLIHTIRPEIILKRLRLTNHLRRKILK